MQSSPILRHILSMLSPEDSAQSILPFIPRPFKWLLLLILIINSRGLPLNWHIRVFRPALYARIYHGFRNLIESPAQRVARLTSLGPIGADPFTRESVFRTRATPDACDFNIHLSNSSYAMTFDMARMKYVVDHFPLFFAQDGAWMGIGATHYAFIREIPLNSPYEARLSIAAWDHKWLYVVARYVTYPSKSQSAKKAMPPTPDPPNGISSSLALPPIVTPADSPSPSRSRSPAPTLPWLGVPLPLGAVLHCTAIVRSCCKIGRITIPPAVAIAASGFGMSSSRFAEVQSLRFQNNGKRLKALYKGGWRDVPEGERWWEDALGGEIEKKRAECLKALAATVGLPVFEPEANA